ncbi:hypothetical protein SEA_RASPUTIA_23 [Microbacterium phage Rasputia]|nr:hypothetical protein SEA_RASPUTIA_23 [Microbacterium phage Rasputia]
MGEESREEPAELVFEENEDGVLELVEDDGIDLDAVPQGKPEGVRLGGDAKRTLATCPTCRGAGKYPIQLFGPPDENGDRHAETHMRPCTTCNGSGKELVFS